METTAVSISAWAFLKNLSYVGAFFATASYLQITPISVGVLTSFILLDVLTGILRSGTINGWHTVTSSVAQRGIIAKLLVLMVPLMLSLIGKGVGIPLGLLAQSTINVLILSEAYSVIGNIHSIRTGEMHAEFDAVAFVLTRVNAMLKKVITDDPKKKI